MSETADLFGESSNTPLSMISPVEPLFSMLLSMPIDSLKYTYKSTSAIEHVSELDSRLENIGLTRREYLNQIRLAMMQRGIE